MYLKYALSYREKMTFFFNRNLINIKFWDFINSTRASREYKDLRYCNRNKTLCIEGEKVILIHRPPSDLENVQETCEHKKEIDSPETTSLPDTISLKIIQLQELTFCYLKQCSYM